MRMLDISDIQNILALTAASINKNMFAVVNAYKTITNVNAKCFLCSLDILLIRRFFYANY